MSRPETYVPKLRAAVGEALHRYAESPPLITALDLLGVPDALTVQVTGVNKTSLSLWRHRRAPIPSKHVPALVELLHTAHQAAVEMVGAHASNDAFFWLSIMRVRTAGEILAVLYVCTQVGEAGAG